MDQLDGIAPIHENWGCNLGEELDDGGDPPRIWAADAKYPGTAFTRSIGDSIAESLGVYAKPELKTLTLDSSHKFIIVASDGVWEFLTSQTVVDMVNDFIDDPEEACRHVVAEAYRLWLEYEVRTDDITMIVMKIVGLDAKGASDGSSKISVSAASRPVRRRRKRQIIASEVSLPEDQEEYDITKHATPKTNEEKKRLEKAVKSNFSSHRYTEGKCLFRHAEEGRQQWRCHHSPGRQGDMFYVVDSGNFDVYVAQNGKVSRQGDDLPRLGPRLASCLSCTASPVLPQSLPPAVELYGP